MIASLTQMERPAPCEIDLECATKAKDDAMNQRNKINKVAGTAAATNDSQRFIPEIVWCMYARNLSSVSITQNH